MSESGVGEVVSGGQVEMMLPNWLVSTMLGAPMEYAEV